MNTTRFPNTTKIGNCVFWVPSSTTRNMAHELETVVRKNQGSTVIVDDQGNTETLSKEAGGVFTNATEINEVTL